MDYKFQDPGEGLAEGVLVHWLVKEGDTVKSDDVVCEIETDKSVAEIPSPVSGKVTKLHFKEGDTVKVGKVLMSFADGDGDDDAAKDSGEQAPMAEPEKTPEPETKQQAEKQDEAKQSSTPEPKTQEQPKQTPKEQPSKNSSTVPLATPATRAYAKQQGVDLASVQPSGPEGRILRKDIDAVKGTAPAKKEPCCDKKESPEKKEQPSTDTHGHVIATPSTRQLARDLGVDLTAVQGTGPAGKITDDDVQKSANGESPQKPASSTQEKPATTEPEKESLKSTDTKKQSSSGTTQPLSSIRKAIATHLGKATSTMAQATHMDSVDVTQLVLLRQREKEKMKERGVKLTYLPFIIKAVVSALKKYPAANASLDEEKQELIMHDNYNIGIAVDTDKGLLVPVIKDADQKSIITIAQEIVDFATNAKEGKLQPNDMRGGTFSISNIGVLGGEWFVPIVNYPQAAILGVCKIKKQPVVMDGQVVVRDMLNLVISYDHRILDGADVARFCNHIMTLLQDPDMLLLES